MTNAKAIIHAVGPDFSEEHLIIRRVNQQSNAAERMDYLLRIILIMISM